ncbi:D-aminoacylase [bacterium]|nr:D-aminoacylase [bacterium]
MKTNHVVGFFLLIFFSFLFLTCGPSPEPFDLVIKNGYILDGCGNPPYREDIGIRGKKIAQIGSISESKAEKVIDAHNLTVTPGFIDVHTHCDRGIDEIPTVDNYLLQGVTTVIGGNCGGHPFPLKSLFQKLENKGISLNFACLIGHNTIRREVMGLKKTLPTTEEMKEMKKLIHQEMKAGAVGFSTGLSYLPGSYSNKEEIVELASAVAPYNGIYASHIRNQGDHITRAVKEAIQVGEKNDIPVQISHIKLAKDSVWGEIERVTKPVEEARERGVNVLLDQYPYTATSSGFTSSFPSWVFEGGRDKFLQRMEDEETYQKVKSYVIERRLASTKGIDKTETIYISRYKENPEYEGKNLKEILVERGQKPNVSNAADLIIEIQKKGGASGVFFQMDEKDVQDLMKLPYIMHASDGSVQEKGEGVPHPRNYGTFPRVISHYVREEGVLPLREAIRKMTSLPAQAFRLSGRGILKEGMYADLTIFDRDVFKDQATFSKPHQYAEGLAYVVVNGEVVVKNNQHTGSRPGMILYGPAKGRSNH